MLTPAKPESYSGAIRLSARTREDLEKLIEVEQALHGGNLVFDNRRYPPKQSGGYWAAYGTITYPLPNAPD